MADNAQATASDTPDDFSCIGLWVRGFLGFSSEEGVLGYSNGELSFHTKDGYELFRFPARDVTQLRFIGIQQSMTFKTTHGTYSIQPQPDTPIHSGLATTLAGVVLNNPLLKIGGAHIYTRRLSRHEKIVLLPIVQKWAEVFSRLGLDVEKPKANYWKVRLSGIIIAVIIICVAFWFMVVVPTQRQKEKELEFTEQSRLQQ